MVSLSTRDGELLGSTQRRFMLASLVCVHIGVITQHVHAQIAPYVFERTDAVLVDDFVQENCLSCHNTADKTGEIDLESMELAEFNQHAATWERVVRVLTRRRMPPIGEHRPSESSYQAVLAKLETALDARTETRRHAGQIETFRRLTRTEYQNAIRDLIGIDVDVDALLPADEASQGFDNVTVGELSPTRLNRYISAAQKISRLAVGTVATPTDTTFRIRPDVTQEEHVAGLPLGTRGGGLFMHHFPQDGDYRISIRLTRDRDELVEGLHETHEMVVLLDGEQMAQFTIAPPAGSVESTYNTRVSHAAVDRHLNAAIPVTAGTHRLGVTFLKNPSSLLETKRQPLNVHFNVYRHPRIGPAVLQVMITGPHDAQGPGRSLSRERIFVCQPTSAVDETQCAEKIIRALLQRAYRRPVDAAELQAKLALFRQAQARAGFDAGIEFALSAILVNPEFLFRIESTPNSAAPGVAYRVTDIDLASRLSFFLWSSLPDDELLDMAIAKRLFEPELVESQVRRMLSDAKADALVTNFAAQWLYLRNLNATAPDMRLYPDFDDNLRQAFRKETELVFQEVVQQDRSVLELLSRSSTYLNERLAKHYDIPHIYGSHFRKVELADDSRRGGLLRHGSILTVTSYATRTSPVVRGKWILENLLGTTPPPPPPDVPALKDNKVSASLSVRERLAEHRANAACATCHNLIDPVGFSLEHYDAVGRWRSIEQGRPVDATGGLPDGSQFVGVDGLEQGLLNRPDVFVSTMVEKLMVYALGRGIEPDDAPTIRNIVRQAKADNYRFSSLILGIVKSEPFQMRTSQ